MSTHLVIIDILNYLETNLLNISKANGYANDILKVHHTTNDLNSEKDFPFIRYWTDDEARSQNNNQGNLTINETKLHVFGSIAVGPALENKNDNLTTALSLSEDLQAYFEGGHWITAGKTCGLVSTKFSYGRVSHLQIEEVSRPYLKANGYYEFEIVLNMKYQQILTKTFN